MSVIGLTNRPTQLLAWTGREKTNINSIMEDTYLHFLNPCSAILNFLAISLGVLVFFAVIARLIPAVPEPELPVKTPFGKLPFFDGIVLYGAIILILLGLLNVLLHQG
jgi:hypothetical protein